MSKNIRPVVECGTAQTGFVALGLFCGCALVLTLCAGCNCGRELGEVEGTVTLDGKPLDGVEVVFMPDPERDTRGPRAAAYTDENGHFKVRTEKAERDGAVLGYHRVCVIDIGAVGTPASLPGMRPVDVLKTEDKKPKGKGARVPMLYNNPAKTPLRAEIKSGQQTLHFNVESGLAKK